MSRWPGVTAAVYAGIVALLVVNALPALINVIALGLKWDDSALGHFAAADVAGITVGSLLGLAIMSRLALRTVVLVGALLLMAADLASVLNPAQSAVITARFLGGCASGIMLAACYALYSYVKPQRNFAAFSLGQMASGFIGVTVIPILSARLGWSSAFLGLAAVTALAVPLSLLLPTEPHRPAEIPASEAHPHSSFTVWLAVAGVVVYVVGEGAVWTFMARMGTTSGIPERSVDTAVSVCELAGVAGALATMFPSARIGPWPPLIFSTVLSVVSCCVMRSESPLVFALSLSGFTFAWLAFATIQFAIIAAADRSGRATVSMSTAWYAGFTVGPYVSGELVDQYGFVPVQILGIIGVLVAFLTLLPLRRGMRGGLSPAPQLETPAS